MYLDAKQRSTHSSFRRHRKQCTRASKARVDRCIVISGGNTLVVACVLHFCSYAKWDMCVCVCIAMPLCMCGCVHVCVFLLYGFAFCLCNNACLHLQCDVLLIILCVQSRFWDEHQRCMEIYGSSLSSDPKMPAS